MTDIEKMREWIKTFKDSKGNGVPDIFQIDFTNEIPQNAALFPDGMIEISRMIDLGRNVTTTNQYSFGLYVVLAKPADVDEISASNAEMVMELQQWGQEQSITQQAPKFGNIQEYNEIIKINNGSFFGDKEGGVGVYMVPITVQFKKYYKAIGGI